MNSLPPDSAFRLANEELDEIRRLRGTTIKPEAFRKKRERWDADALLTCIAGSHRVYPYLADVIALCKANPADYKSPLGDIPQSDALKYRLLGDCYAEGLYAPTPSYHRLHGLLDFLYFPDLVKAECDEAHPDSFSNLIRLWELMALTVDDTLYRHSSTAYALYAPLWKDFGLRFKIGFKLISIAVYYGDYVLSKKLIHFLKAQVESLEKERIASRQTRTREAMRNDEYRINYYADELRRLELNSEAHTHDIEHYSKHIEEYAILYRRVSDRNRSVANMSEERRMEHARLLRGICRGACRYSVRYVARKLSNNEQVEAGEFEEFQYLRREYLRPQQNYEYIDHSAVTGPTSHDWDTLSRVYSMVMTEIVWDSTRCTENTREPLYRASRYLNHASTAKVDICAREAMFLLSTLGQPELSPWVNGVDENRVLGHIGTLSRFWEGLSQAMLSLQQGRFQATAEADKTARFNEVQDILYSLESEATSRNLHRSNFLLSSVQRTVKIELWLLNHAGKEDR